jgi:hypothetical protein
MRNRNGDENNPATEENKNQIVFMLSTPGN